VRERDIEKSLRERETLREIERLWERERDIAIYTNK
jgi:hypothetical protein